MYSYDIVRHTEDWAIAKEDETFVWNGTWQLPFISVALDVWGGLETFSKHTQRWRRLNNITFLHQIDKISAILTHNEHFYFNMAELWRSPTDWTTFSSRS